MKLFSTAARSRTRWIQASRFRTLCSRCNAMLQAWYPSWHVLTMELKVEMPQLSTDRWFYRLL